jgi:phage-related protein (TIGR01555 family)
MEIDNMSKRNRKNVDAAKTSNAANPAAQTMDQKALDAFQNLAARLGFGSNNLNEGAEYPLTRLTRNYQLLTSLYRSHWIIRKIIDTIPEDMMKNWITLTCQLDPKAIDAFNKVVRKTRIKEKLLEGLQWGRLYGGAAAIMLIKGHENYLDQPLNLDAVLPDSFKGLLVLDRWSGIAPFGDLITDINDPDFGLPATYQITIDGGQTFKVHSSRVIRFTGRKLPYYEKVAENNWSVSEVEVIFDELKKRDNTSWNIASLIFLANIRVLKMGKLGQMLGLGNVQAQQQLNNTLSAQNALMSNQGMMVLDKDDEFDTKTYTFSGINDIYESFMLDLAGASEIPVTKLFGRAPAGMNATGESDSQNYDGNIETKQEANLRPALDKLFPVMAVSLWGFVPDDFDYKFNPVRSISTEKLAEISGKFTDSVDKVFNSGIIGRKTALKELRQASEITGVFSNISDEEIEAATDEIEMNVDLPVFGPEGEEVTGKQPEDSDADLAPLKAAGLLSPLGNIKKVATDHLRRMIK